MRVLLVGIAAVSALLLVRPVAATPSLCDSNSGNLVVNCGFENGDLTGWTVSDFSPNSAVDTAFPNSGDYAFDIANNLFLGDNPLTVQQSFSTFVGDTLTVRFWLAESTPPDTSPSNSFMAKYNDIILLNLTDVGPLDYGEYTFHVAGTGNDTLSFTAYNNVGGYFLDDVSVNAPEPSSLTLLGAGLSMLWMRRRRNPEGMVAA